MIEVRGLTKRYGGIVAVRDVTFTIARGEILGYLGPNGSGKSTTVKMITGLIDRTAGEIFLDGQKVTADSPEFRARIGYVPEEAHVYSHLSGREYLLLVGRLRGIARKPLNEKI